MPLTADKTDVQLGELCRQMVSHIQLEHSEIVRNWFEEIEILSFEGGLINIGAPGKAQQQYLITHCKDAFCETMQSLTGRLLEVTFGITADSNPSNAEAMKAGNDELMLSDDFTFSTFVAGDCNKLAHAASSAVARNPGKQYNPLFIHGDVGLGKTHLLQAICHGIREQAPDSRIIYLSCETFINHFIEAVEMGNLHEFRHRYRNADVLVIDDVQFFANKDSSQEEFFHTFNTLYHAQKQMILSSDRPPSEIETLTERLISRFSWGLVAGIDHPCLETRMAIINKKAKMKGLEIPGEVAVFLARAIDSNTRELEGAITKLQGLSTLTNTPITIDLAREAVPSHLNRHQELTINQIVEAVTNQFGVKVTELQSKRRNKTLALPRQVCMFLARRLTRWSLEEIGGYFGGRDHSTVLHANKTIYNLIEHDEGLKNTIESIARNLTGSSSSFTLPDSR